MAHPARHREVADAHLPQIVVEVAAEHVEQPLPERLADSSAAWFAAPDQPVQATARDAARSVEPALDGVGHPIIGVKGRRARLRHDHAIERVDVAAVGTAPKRL